jgi:hypothetical protein
LVIAPIILVILTIAWVVHEYGVLHDRRLHKAEATAYCLAQVRERIRDELDLLGVSPGEAQKSTSTTQFIDVDVVQSIVSQDLQTLLPSMHQSESSVVAVWEMGGKVSIPGRIPFGTLESHDTFSCNAVVFTDGTARSFAIQIDQGW